jgi:mannose-6-phosphate isomerase-like protein (cupin superfamily)
MRRKAMSAILAAVVVAGPGVAARADDAVSAPSAPGGYVLERDADVAKRQPGPHQGLGQTTGHVFFEKVPGLSFSFRKRVLHPGSSIGYHPQSEDEVYYVVSGAGRMTIDGKTFEVKPGDATLTRPGSSHGLVQAGDDDLVLIIVFPTGHAAGPGR